MATKQELLQKIGALEEENKQKTSLIDNHPEPIIQATLDTKITLANQAAKEIFEIEPTVANLEYVLKRLYKYSKGNLTGFRQWELEKRVGEKTYSFRIEPDERWGVLNIYGKEITGEIRESLTNLYNQAYFKKRLLDKIESYLRDEEHNKKPLSFVFIDIDDFKKKINDRYGHLVGNRVLKVVAGIIEKNTRADWGIDIPSRYGGEEFVIALPGVGVKESKNIGERIRKIIEVTEIQGKNETYNVTVSVGVSYINPRLSEYKKLLDKVRESPELLSKVVSDIAGLLINQADDALYDAKSKGKNCTLIYRA